MTAPIYSPEWHAERRTYIGASEAAAAIGLSPWTDPVELWEQKLGLAPDKVSTFRMRFGSLVEPVIGKLYEEQEGRKLRAFRRGPLRLGPDAPWIGANPDFAIVGGDGLVQAKASREFGDDTADPDSIPLHYRLQGLIEMAATGRRFVDFAVLGQDALRVYRQPFDPDACFDLVADLTEFWTYVESKTMPPVTPRSGSALLRRFPKSELVGKVATADQEQKLRTLIETDAQARAADEALELARNEVRAMIGSAHYVEGLGRRFTWTRFDRQRTDWKLVAKAYRALIEAQRSYPAGTIDDLRVTEDGDPLDTIEGLYTITEPSHRLTFTKGDGDE